MSLFTSHRERNLWLLVLVVLAAIYATLGLTGMLAGALRDRGLISAAFWLGLFLIGAAIVIQGLKTRPGKAEIGVALGVAGVYLIAFLRMTVPEERTHLIEYSLVAILIYLALSERQRNGRQVPVPAVLAIAATELLGLLDEGIQALLPNRVFDFIDIGFNAGAGFMAVIAILALAWARRWGGRFVKAADVGDEHDEIAD
jgi:hypothetical protein